jgi:hypothetical protein
VKRDLLLCAEIIKGIEGQRADLVLGKFPQEVIDYHVRLLEQAGFIAIENEVFVLTMKGFDFYEYAILPEFKEWHDKIAFVNSGGVAYDLLIDVLKSQLATRAGTRSLSRPSNSLLKELDKPVWETSVTFRRPDGWDKRQIDWEQLNND